MNSNEPPPLDSDGTPLLWRDTRTVGGVTYTAEVIEHWFAGHGKVEGYHRWTVYRESAYRPKAGGGVVSGLDVAIGAAARYLASITR